MNTPLRCFEIRKSAAIFSTINQRGAEICAVQPKITSESLYEITIPIIVRLISRVTSDERQYLPSFMMKPAIEESWLGSLPGKTKGSHVRFHYRRWQRCN